MCICALSCIVAGVFLLLTKVAGFYIAQRDPMCVVLLKGYPGLRDPTALLLAVLIQPPWNLKPAPPQLSSFVVHSFSFLGWRSSSAAFPCWWFSSYERRDRLQAILLVRTHPGWLEEREALPPPYTTRLLVPGPQSNSSPEIPRYYLSSCDHFLSQLLLLPFPRPSFVPEFLEWGNLPSQTLPPPLLKSKYTLLQIPKSRPLSGNFLQCSLRDTGAGMNGTIEGIIL